MISTAIFEAFSEKAHESAESVDAGAPCRARSGRHAPGNICWKRQCRAARRPACSATAAVAPQAHEKRTEPLARALPFLPAARASHIHHGTAWLCPACWSGAVRSLQDRRRMIRPSGFDRIWAKRCQLAGEAPRLYNSLRSLQRVRTARPSSASEDSSTLSLTSCSVMHRKRPVPFTPLARARTQVHIHAYSHAQPH